MNREVITYNLIEGFHYWEDAVDECKYLSSKHRHLFSVRCWFSVQHNDREIEINTKQTEILNLFRNTFGEPCDFGNRSCEDIAEWLLGIEPQLNRIEVLEDGYGGAALSR